MADLGVCRPTTGEWFFLYSLTNYNPSTFGYFAWGVPGDQPTMGDWDGDGKTDIAVYRPSCGMWFISYSSNGYSPAQAGSYGWGPSGDLALPGNQWPVHAESIPLAGRGIPAGGVAHHSLVPNKLALRALRPGRRAPASDTDSARTGH